MSKSFFFATDKEIERNKDQDAVATPKWADSWLFETALLTSGLVLDDFSSFAKRIHHMIALGLDVDEEDEVANAPAESAELAVEEIATSTMEEID